MSRSKLSIAAILCRENKVFLVKCRVQFAYREFVFGKYQMRDPSTILALLNKMTVLEKIQLMKQDFSAIWKHIFITSSLSHVYVKCKARFEKYTSDGGKRLMALIRVSTSIDNEWSFPRGRPDEKETEMDCIIRECYEEGDIIADQITPVDTPVVVTQYSTFSCNYTTKHYVFNAIKPISTGVNFANPHQYQEVSDTGWFSIKQLKQINCQATDISSLAKAALKSLRLARVLPILEHKDNSSPNKKEESIEVGVDANR